MTTQQLGLTIDAAGRLAKFAEIATQGTPGQAPAYRDAAYMQVYNGTPHSQIADTLAVSKLILDSHSPPRPAARVLYRNHRGEVAVRYIVPHGIRFTATDWHPEPQWVLDVFDVDKQAWRTFAVRDILDWNPPADDDEPLTVDWLLSVGFFSVADAPHPRWEKTLRVQHHELTEQSTVHWMTVHEPCDDGDGNVWWPVNLWQKEVSDPDHDKDGVALLSWLDHTTRGDLRRLCLGLGCPLTLSPDGGR